MTRGELSKRVLKKALDIIGRKISIRELRLMPYIQYVMMNEQKLDIAKINGDERKILKKWKEEGFIEGGASGLSVTKDFWDFINEILFLAYVDLNEEYIEEMKKETFETTGLELILKQFLTTKDINRAILDIQIIMKSDEK